MPTNRLDTDSARRFAIVSDRSCRPTVGRSAYWPFVSIDDIIFLFAAHMGPPSGTSARTAPVRPAWGRRSGMAGSYPRPGNPANT